MTKRFHFTVDVDWIPGSESGVEGLLRFCAEYRLRASFLITGRMAVDYPELFRSAASAGHEIGSHGWEHGQRARDQEEDFEVAPYAQQSDWMARSTEAIERAAGVRPSVFRAPNLKVGETTLRVLEDLNYRYDSSVPARRLTVTYGRWNSPRYYWAPLAPYAPASDNLSRVGTSGITELAPSAFFVPLNMSALRVFGLRALTWAIEAIRKRSDYLVFFSHPSEFTLPERQQLSTHNPARHLRGIGPHNFALLGGLVEHITRLGYQSSLFSDLTSADTLRARGADVQRSTP